MSWMQLLLATFANSSLMVQDTLKWETVFYLTVVTLIRKLRLSHLSESMNHTVRCLQ